MRFNPDTEQNILKAAGKNIAASIELEKAAQKDLYPKLSGNANFQYTGNPLELTLDLPSMGNPVTSKGRILNTEYPYPCNSQFTQAADYWKPYGWPDITKA